MSAPIAERSAVQSSSTRDGHTETFATPRRSLDVAIGYALLLAVGYFAAGKLGLLLAIPPGYATAIWPASGIALGALLILGPRYWPGIWLGSFSVNLLATFDSSSPEAIVRSLTIAGIIAAGASAQAVVGARLVYRQTGGSLSLARERDIFSFYVLGGPVTHLVSATFGVTTLYIAGAIPTAALLDNWWTWWTGDTIGALIFAPLLIMWCGGRADWASRRFIVTVPLLTMFVAAVAIFVYTSRSEWRDLRQRFADDTAHLGNAIAQHVAVDIELLRALNAYLLAAPSVDDTAFQHFAGNILTPHKEILGVQWAPRVDADERTAFEAAMRRKGHADFAIHDAGNRSIAATRAQYFPVALSAPSIDGEVGIDIASEPMRGRLIDTSLSTRYAAVPLALPRSIQSGPSEAAPMSGLLLATPVLDSRPGASDVSASAHDNLRGFVLATLNTSRLLAAALRDKSMTTQVHLQIEDITAGDAALPIAIYRTAEQDGAQNDWARRTDFGRTMNIQVANRTWLLRFQPTLEYLAGRKPTTAWLVLAGGLMFTALIGAGALLITGRGLSVEMLVTQRTRELAHINETLAEEICDHLNTEHALDKERESLKAVLNNLHEGILVFDVNGQLRIANGAALRMHRQITGHELEYLSQPTPFKVFSADGNTPIDGDHLPQAHALRGETVRDFEMVAQADGREALCLSVNAQPLFTSDGKQHGAIVVVRDITDSRKIERLKTEFVATVSHELRTPITSIRGSLGLIAGGAAGPMNDKIEHLVNIAMRNSDRLAHLINDLLDIEKIESGNMQFDLQRHALSELIAQAIEANNGYAQTFNVRLLAAPPLPKAFVNVDAFRLLQVMANLLSNAAKFSPSGASVEVSAIESHGLVRVQVRDRGPGIAEEFRPRLFKKFSQADASDARTKSGTGLGLAICKSIVEHMGGSIGYETELGVGTTFYFELPVVGHTQKAQLVAQ